MAQIEPVVSGLTGLGGYAANICKLLLHERGQASGDPGATARLAAVCSSNPARHPERVAELKSHGVKVCESYEQMLAEPDIEAIWLPLPIDLHVPYTTQAVEAGKAVMLEKPIAGTVQDVDSLIDLRDRHGREVLVGYQDIYDPATVEVKQRLLDGAIGKVQSACLWAVWPRDSSYYGRADWAGRLKKGDTWILDSPANNALAHFINIGLFFLGRQMLDSAEPVEVEAELYRVNDIENYDTIACRLTLSDGVPFIVLLTHAGTENHHPRIQIDGDGGCVNWTFEGPVSVEPAAGGREDRAWQGQRSDRPQRYMADRFAKQLRGVTDADVAISTLENARPQTLAINGASEAAAIVDVPPEYIETHQRENGTLRAIKGIADAFARCAAEGKLLHETGQYPWTVQPGRRDLRGYRTFAGPAATR